MARQLEAAGADGLVLFNRFYQPDIDIKTLKPMMVNVELAGSSELRLRLRWLAILFLAGADVVQIVSALLRHGPTHVDAMRQGLERWMAWCHFERLEEARGRVSLEQIADAESYERAHYIRTLQSWLA